MTGKQKIQVIIDAIDTAYQDLITGNVITIHSFTLEKKGLNLDDQKQVLDLLTSRGNIKYDLTYDYKSKADIDENARHFAAKIADKNMISYQERIEQLLVSGMYTVEVLKEFEPTSITPNRVDSEMTNTTEIHSPKIEVHKFKPQNYVEHTGVLHLSPIHDVAIAKNGKTRRPKSKEKYDQCWLMECLFKNVKTLNSGILFSKFLGVKYDEKNKKHIKKIRNTITEINNKVSEVGGPNNLIKIQGDRIIFNNSYLL